MTRDPRGDPLCVTPAGIQMTALHLPETPVLLWQNNADCVSAIHGHRHWRVLKHHMTMKPMSSPSPMRKMTHEKNTSLLDTKGITS